MLRRSFNALLLALPLLATTPAFAQEKPKVVTTFTIIADIAANVAGDAATVESITKPGAEIHNYQPTPRDILKAQDAKLVLWNGLNLELWFQKFLAKFLTEKNNETQRLVSVAQQVEQKEAMAIQYTIELRRMLNDMPVRDEIREFLFKVWAEVLALAALKYGGQDEQTVMLKRVASELVWAASAKPNRGDRTRVIQELPKLLQRLRQGMELLGVTGPPQEEHIKTIGKTLSDAFMSKTAAIAPAQIEAMASRLANLEEVVQDDDNGTELPMDTASVELLLGVDADSIEVVPNTGTKVTEEMLAWAHELQVGNWFMLDHNGRATQVQFVWRSERKHLHLFGAPDGRKFLIQAGRLASYLQAGLLVPAEEETLTARATREALAKLDANPERLLS